MAFTLPNFNQTCNVWIAPNTPSMGAADFSEICQLYVQTKLSVVDDTSFATSGYIQAFIRVPYQAGQFGLDYVIECPSGFGQYLAVTYGMIVHLGFPNQYLLLSVRQCSANRSLIPWPTY